MLSLGHLETLSECQCHITGLSTSCRPKCGEMLCLVNGFNKTILKSLPRNECNKSRIVNSMGSGSHSGSQVWGGHGTGVGHRVTPMPYLWDTYRVPVSYTQLATHPLPLWLQLSSKCAAFPNSPAHSLAHFSLFSSLQ
jgi:hypothetical protein